MSGRVVSLIERLTAPRYNTSIDSALALAEQVVGEDHALALLADVLALHEASGLSIKDIPRHLLIAILKAKETK